MRIGDWKVVFAEQRAKEFDVWREQFHTLRIPKVISFASRPLRACRRALQHLQRLVGEDGATSPDYGASGVAGFPRDLEGVPATAATRDLYD